MAANVCGRNSFLELLYHLRVNVFNPFGFKHFLQVLFIAISVGDNTFQHRPLIRKYSSATSPKAVVDTAVDDLRKLEQLEYDSMLRDIENCA